MKSHGVLISLTLGVLVSASIAVGQDKPAPTSQQAAGEACKVDRLRLATELAKYGSEAKDPYALIVAAGMIQDLAVGVVEESRLPSDEKARGAALKSADSNQSANALLDAASNLAKGDKTVTELIATVRGKQEKTRQFAYRGWAHNTLGYTFWATEYSCPAAVAAAVVECQLNTPYGAYCYADGCR
jgi:hypothetical protein